MRGSKNVKFYFYSHYEIITCAFPNVIYDDYMGNTRLLRYCLRCALRGIVPH